MWNIFSQPSFLVLLLLWWTRGLVKRNRQTCGIRLRASTDSNQRTNSYKIYTTDMQLCPTYKMASRTLKRHITMILGFWHWDFNKGCQTHNFVEFPRSVSSLEFSRVKSGKPKNSRVFFRKIYPQPVPHPSPLFFFSGIAHSWFTDCCYTA